MRVTVRAFATVREHLGAGRLELDLEDGVTLGDVVRSLDARIHAEGKDAGTLARWLADGHLLLAHNLVHAPPETILADGDEVALFPPVSGG